MQTTWKKRILQILLLLSLTAFACWFALKDDCAEVLYNIFHISWYWIVLIAVLGTAYYLLQGIVLYRIAKPYKTDIRIWDGIHNAYIAAFFNGVTPLGGGQVAQTYAFRKLDMQYSDIASVLWKDFFLYQSTVLFYVSILLLTRFSYAMEHFQIYFFSGAAWLCHQSLCHTDFMDDGQISKAVCENQPWNCQCRLSFSYCEE